MKTASAALQAHLSQGQTTLAHIWKVTRTDGTLLGFTTHDQDIVYPPGGGPYYRPLTIDHTKCGASDSVNFTFPVVGVYSYLATVAHGGKVQNSSGFDITFSTDSAGMSLLSWEIEFYDPTSGTIVAWVKVPTASHTVDTTIYMRYGNSAIVTFQGGAAGAAWNSAFAAVYHLSDDAASTTVLDSTASPANGAAQANTNTKTTAGKIDGALTFNGSTDKITVANVAKLDVTAGGADFTISVWFNATSNTGYITLFSTVNRTYSFFIASNTLGYWDVAPAGGTGWSGTGWTANAWHHLVMVRQSGTTTAYLDGATAFSYGGFTGGHTGDDLVIGGGDVGGGILFPGTLDEFRMSNTARSADWITTEYNSQNSPSTFYSLGSETAMGGVSPTTYLASTGFNNTAVKGHEDVSVDNLEVFAFLESSSLTEPDIRAGLYDDALIEIRIVNWADLTMGDMIERTGTIGTIKMKNGQLTAEIRGLTDWLRTVVGGTYGPVCRAEFGSGLNGIDLNSKYLCNIDVTLYRQTGSVSSVTDARTLVPTAGLKMVGSATPTVAAPADWFDYGLIHFTSGVLSGYTFEIKSWDATSLGLFLALPYMPAASDTFWIEPGCNKTADNCVNPYNNIVNFRGEPFIPGNDQVLGLASN